MKRADAVRTSLRIHALRDRRLKPQGAYKGKFDPRVRPKAFRALHDIAA